MNININEVMKEITEKIPYRDSLIEEIEPKLLKVIEFFEITNLENIKIKIWNNIDEYKEHISKYTEYKEEMCADTFDGVVNILEINEARKTNAHKTMTYEEYTQNIVHEFVHICQQRKEKEHDEEDKNSWFYEALATNLGNPEQFSKLIYFTVDKKEIEKFNELGNNRYEIAYTIGRFLLENYSKEEILELVEYPSKLSKLTSKIIEDTRDWVDYQAVNKK